MSPHYQIDKNEKAQRPKTRKERETKIFLQLIFIKLLPLIDGNEATNLMTSTGSF